MTPAQYWYYRLWEPLGEYIMDLLEAMFTPYSTFADDGLSKWWMIPVSVFCLLVVVPLNILGVGTYMACTWKRDYNPTNVYSKAYLPFGLYNHYRRSRFFQAWEDPIITQNHYYIHKDY